MWLDIRPFDVFRGLKQLIDRVWSLGFDAIREIANYILAGAALVVPIWLVLRLMNMRNGH
jgi:ABC-type branched-subunit amino acid transport system permease subunit